MFNECIYIRHRLFSLFSVGQILFKFEREYDVHFGWSSSEDSLISGGWYLENENYPPTNINSESGDDLIHDVFPFIEPFQGGIAYTWACSMSILRALTLLTYKNIIKSFEEIKTSYFVMWSSGYESDEEPR